MADRHRALADERALLSGSLPPRVEGRVPRLPSEREPLAFPVPTAALELGVLLRHVEIDGEFADWAAAAAHIAQASARWERMASTLASRLIARRHVRGAMKAAGELPRLLEQAGRAVRRTEAHEVLRLARRGIVLMDVVQRVFE